MDADLRERMRVEISSLVREAGRPPPAGTAGTLPALRPATRDDAAPVTLRPADEAVLAIRPTGVRLASLTDGSPHLTGRVADVAFRGRGYEYAIDLPGLGRVTGVFARHRADRGDSVGLRLDPEGCHLFPADAKSEEKDTTSPAPALTA